MGDKERAPRGYLKKLRKIAHTDEASRVAVARPTFSLEAKISIWNEGGWAKLSLPEYRFINQRIKRLKELLPEKKHQTQLDAFYLGRCGRRMYDDIQFLNKNLWELLIRLEKTASVRNHA